MPRSPVILVDVAYGLETNAEFIPREIRPYPSTVLEPTDLKCCLRLRHDNDLPPKSKILLITSLGELCRRRRGAGEGVAIVIRVY
jgi:hypothetical protein